MPPTGRRGGAVVGPLDPESTQEFGRVDAENSALELMRRVRANAPEELIGALARPRDADRSEALDAAEVAEIAGVEELAGKPAVRGESDDDRVVSYLYVKNGRSVRGVFPYSRATRSIAAYEEALDTQRAAGIPPTAGRDEKSQRTLQAQIERLEQRLDEAETRAEKAEEASTDVDELRRRVEDAERVAAEAVAEREELARRMADPEPFDGYDEANATDIVGRLKDGTADAERVLDYEGRHKNRETVIKAAEKAIQDAQAGGDGESGG